MHELKHLVIFNQSQSTVLLNLCFIGAATGICSKSQIALQCIPEQVETSIV